MNHQCYSCGGNCGGGYASRPCQLENIRPNPRRRWANRRDRMSMSAWLEAPGRTYEAKYDPHMQTITLRVPLSDGCGAVEVIPFTELWTLDPSDGWRNVVARRLSRIRYNHQHRTPPAPYRCKYCGAPSWIDPTDQVPPKDFCHFGDHGP